MNPDFQRVKALFLMAAEKQTPTDRCAFLDEACGGENALRAQVEVLLNAHDDADGFLKPMTIPMATVDDSSHFAECPGTVLGPYKLLQEIGEGGMGTVFLAEQTEPVRRKVALKIIKPGLDSGQIIARFEAERQALALMDHPNIARVLDAGTTETGRPYFVMELVKGSSITTYCDENRLTPRQRLELFIPVCQAIQHAHQKGIIHRDIKPSNVLVAIYDGKPVPKVIDFGIAKATDQPLTEKTLFTRHGQIVGTFEYMSPEQATLDSLDVDTRSDIYSLGVLLYELLTGTTPLDKERLRQAALLEVLRLIREEEPPKPSTRLSESRGALVAASAHRQTDADKLSGLVAGELDWIVMKSLDKDRARRYETANGLAMDVQRYLKDEQVQACPPSASYRLRKFARRNKAALATSGLVATALFLGTTVSIWQAFEANDARQLAEDRLENEKFARTEAVENARKADKQRVLVESNMALTLRILGVIYEREYLGRPLYALQDKKRRKSMETDIAFYEELLRKQRDVGSESLQLEIGKANLRLGGLYVGLKQWEHAERAYRQGIATFEKRAQQFPDVHDHQRSLHTGNYWLSEVLFQQKRSGEGVDYARKCLSFNETEYAKAPTNANCVLGLVEGLRMVAQMTDSPQEAAQFRQRRIDLIQELVDESPAEDKYRSMLAGSHNILAWQLTTTADQELRDPKRALAHAERAVELNPHPDHLNTLGMVHYRNGNWKDAVSTLNKTFQLVQGENFGGYFFLAMAYRQLGDNDQARIWYDKGVKAREKVSPTEAQARAHAEAAEVLGIAMPSPKTKN